jgi:hypothetical protein
MGDGGYMLAIFYFSGLERIKKSQYGSKQYIGLHVVGTTQHEVRVALYTSTEVI